MMLTNETRNIYKLLRQHYIKFMFNSVGFLFITESIHRNPISVCNKHCLVDSRARVYVWL